MKNERYIEVLIKYCEKSIIEAEQEIKKAILSETKSYYEGEITILKDICEKLKYIESRE